MKKLISILLSIAMISMYVNYSFANTAFDQAQQAAKSDRAFDGKADLKLNIQDPGITKDVNLNKDTQSTPNTDTTKPSFMTKVGWDIKANKGGYITMGIASGLLGFILGGPLGALIGIGAMFAFTISQRAWYIDAFAKPS